jgi:hypothetical protein
MKTTTIIRFSTLALALIALATMDAHRAKGHHARVADGLHTPADGVRYINSTDTTRDKYQ